MMTHDPAYTSDLGTLLLFLAGGFLFIALMLLISRWLRPNRPGPEKEMPYESGEMPVSTAWPQFNLRFYVIAIVFLLFDVELAFLFPWTTVYAKRELIEGTGGLWGWFSFFEMLIFILLLALGLIYAWARGHLNWVRPMPDVPRTESPVPNERYEAINRKYAGSRKPDNG